MLTVRWQVFAPRTSAKDVNFLVVFFQSREKVCFFFARSDFFKAAARSKASKDFRGTKSQQGDTTDMAARG